MTLKEFQMLSTVFIFVLVAGLIFMLQSHAATNAHSDVAYIDEFQVVTFEDEQNSKDKTDVPDKEYAESSRMDQLVELIGFIK
ncbi:hypothetical protein WN59_00510 [Salinicoccus sediminis]|uniref:Uncharacterized protein n=1 Tax=Salinicoccus sediminis TaxID=1432562 RepID=A0A0M2SL10_9STAP|nr:hypothetical protein [Salinicoccus sediminis]KKK35354.1 hypothetical protein WN59_00510 [Salinicoccus sediminis]